MAYVNRKSGYWKFSEMQFDGYSCSVCHTKYPMFIGAEKYRFCPECGSRMVEVRNERKETGIYNQ